MLYIFVAFSTGKASENKTKEFSSQEDSDKKKNGKIIRCEMCSRKS